MTALCCFVVISYSQSSYYLEILYYRDVLTFSLIFSIVHLFIISLSSSLSYFPYLTSPIIIHSLHYLTLYERHTTSPYTTLSLSCITESMPHSIFNSISGNISTKLTSS